MRPSDGLKVAVTGAAGFIGRAVVELIDRGELGAISELRLNDLQTFEHPNALFLTGSYADAAVRARLVADEIDVLFHLASLPGGAAERDPDLGKTVNLDGSIALFDAVARPEGPIVVYASSIAVLGANDRPVTDATQLRPAGSYGTHKAMIELYLADLTRRGVIDGRAIRLAGIVARPKQAYGGFATAWMSDIFHAAVERRDVAVPVRAEAHVWLQSIDMVARNIVHAARMPVVGLSRQRAWTLPATVVQIKALVEALNRRTGHSQKIEYGDGPADHPPLDACAAEALGFMSDGEVDALVYSVLSRIAGPSDQDCLDP